MPIANPALLAQCLEYRNRLRAWRRRPATLAGVLAGLGALVVLALAAAPVPGAQRLIAWVSAHPGNTLAIVAALTAIRAMRLRRRWLADRDRSWLAALPVTAAQTARAHALRLAGAQLAPLAALLAGSGLLAAAAGAHRDLPLLAALAGAGLLVGTPVGGLLGGRAARTPAPRALRTRAGHDARLACGWAVLAAWPLRQAFAQADPGVHARVIGAVLLAMPLPMSTSLGLVLPALLELMAVLFLAECLRGLLTTIAASAGWLRSTALPPRRLARALIGTSLAVQAGAAAVAGALLLVGVAPGDALLAALAGWALAASVAALAWHHHHPWRPDR